MNWTKFLTDLCQQKNLTLVQTEVLACLAEGKLPTKEEWRQTYIESVKRSVEIEAFTQRLRNIYRKFDITDRGEKLPILYRLIKDKYEEYQSKDVLFSGTGLTNIHPRFPDEIFKQKINNVIF
jgi:DNA-binding CsgD family transcriptional regulator